jgi:hypothetical protein
MSTVSTPVGPGNTEILIKPASPAPGRSAAPAVAPGGRLPQTAEACRIWVEQARLALQAVENQTQERLEVGLEAALRHRQQFWIDTCREVMEMRFASPQVLELHRIHGCRFCPPSTAQAQYILDALDAALQFWDRDHPGLFYQTLELNFPEVLRACRNRHRF